MRDVSSPSHPCHRLDDAKTTAGPKRGIRRTLFSFLEDVDFAKEVALLSHTRHDMQEKINAIYDVREK